jgi:hypothetical protein
MLRCVKAWHVVGIAALAMTVVESGSLSAQSFVASPGQKQDIDLDSGDGSLSVWQHKDLRSLSAMKATIKVVRLGKDATFDPYFTVRVTAGEAFYGVRLQPAGGRLTLRAYYREPQRADVDVTTFKRTLALDEKVDVELFWKGGKLFVRVADEKSEMPLPKPVSMVGITSTTGEIEADIALGNMR